jgi:hypothetical protein
MNPKMHQAQNELVKSSRFFTIGGLATTVWTFCLILGSTVVANAQTRKCNPKDESLPIARLLAGSAVVDVSKGIPLKTKLLVIEPEFLDKNSNDCQYFVTALVLQINGGAPITIKSGSIALGQYNLKTGDKLSVSQVQVARSTSDGGTKQVNGMKMSFTCKMN